MLPTALTWSPERLGDRPFDPPSRTHWLGTDLHGRDVLSRLLDGTSVSLLVGAVGACVSLGIGVLWGAAAGFLGGRWDQALMRLVDALYALPTIVLVLVLIALLEDPLRETLGRFGSEVASSTRLLLLVLGIGSVSWLTMARIVRGQVLSLRGRAFVEASRALGARPGRLLFRHILPNTYGIVIAYLLLAIPSVILSESFLSYLGLGIQPPHASLGYLLADGAASLNPVRVYWWLVVYPAVLLATTLLALHSVGDALRDALDPRTTDR